MLKKILKKTNPNLIVIVGPTAIGKTSLSIELAKHFSCPIISADSRQFFKEMSIGTAKPTPEEMQGITHYFIDSHSITDTYNVGKFEEEALALLDQLFRIHETVIMVGGSGLYINAVCEGFDELPEADEITRKKINDLYNSQGIEGLQTMLKQLDPVYFNQVDQQNPQRLSRALEVCLLSGEPYSSLRKKNRKERQFNCIKIGINTSREILYQRINLRVDQMMQQGLLNEVKKLEPFKHLNALQTVGYKELFDSLSELNEQREHAAEYKKILERAVNNIKQNTRRFAKRQLTWFRRDEEIKWFEPQEISSILTYISEYRIKHA
ncbi:MAG TPA: tRNA (adenosine(37)-N6)-dimethylallyltransferase MiaA [Bacteroidia bacterium]|nr:tRNA (adenosine(37)-N6)-dimethylallyltransferase MiaA [Bacteroidia bacterium]